MSSVTNITSHVLILANYIKFRLEMLLMWNVAVYQEFEKRTLLPLLSFLYPCSSHLITKPTNTRDESRKTKEVY